MMRIAVLALLLVVAAAGVPQSPHGRRQHVEIPQHQESAPVHAEQRKHDVPRKEDVVEMRATLDQMKKDLYNLGKELQRMKIEENTRTAAQQDSTIVSQYKAVANTSFSAYQDGGLVEVVEGDTILFTDIEHASAPNYNPATSFFTCGVRGVHFFTASVGVQSCTPGDDPDVCRVALVRNGDVIAGASGNDAASYSLMTMTVITECSPGDHIYVRMRAGDASIEGSSVGRETRFSGFLLYEV